MLTPELTSSDLMRTWVAKNKVGKLYLASAAAFHSTTWHPVPKQPTKVTVGRYHHYLQNQLLYPHPLPLSLRCCLSCGLSTKSQGTISVASLENLRRLCCWTSSRLPLSLLLAVSHHSPKPTAQTWPRGWPPKPMCPKGTIRQHHPYWWNLYLWLRYCLVLSLILSVFATRVWSTVTSCIHSYEFSLLDELTHLLL